MSRRGGRCLNALPREARRRWLNREVSQVPLCDFRRSAGLTAKTICSDRSEKGQERWIRAISAWASALSRLGGGPLRVFYAFDPRRTSILLIGGDKTGNDRFYEEYVPVADALYDEHLEVLRKEGLLE